MMKSIRLRFLSFILLAVVANNVFAQEITAEKKHEVSLGVGVGTVQELVAVFSNLFTSGILGSEVVEDKASGAFTLSYQYLLSKRFTVGASTTWESFSTTYKNPTQTLKWNVIVPMAHCRYYYTSGRLLNVYGHLAAGGAFYFSDNSSLTTFAFQLTPLGLRIGNKFAAFGELGFGFEGLVKAGAAFRF